MAEIAIFTAIFSAAATGFSGLQEMQNSRAREDIARVNQQYATINSVQELRLASLEEQRVRREGNKQLAEQFAGFAQSGAGVGDFSTVKALEESATMAELDALNVRYKGQIASRDQAIAASQYDYEARSEKGVRSSIAVKTGIGMATSLLSGYSKYRGAKIA
jgi:hypothetical protein